MPFRTLVAPILLVLALAVAACGPAGTASSAPSVVPSVEPSTPPSPSEAPSPSEEPTDSEEPSAGDETVAIAESDDFGQILVDGEGMTLYGFVPDEAGGEPTCYDDCAVAWPPLLETDEVTVGAGLDSTAFELVERTDGGMQVKIGSFPLYYWASDSAPGDTTGQGVGGVWFVVSPAGELIEE
jgi:predicted lipoprotein with Yx(FWY)xxD motif